MGNCQAIDAAALVIQHPNGKIERFYCPMTASEVMKTNPGHYVSLIIPLPESDEDENRDPKTVKFTRVKILRASETLALGHAYRLVTSEEVMKVLWAKKFAKMKKQKPDLVENMQKEPEKCRRSFEEKAMSRAEQSNQAAKHGRQRLRRPNGASTRSKSWCPSLQSISESAADAGLFIHSELAD